MRMSSRTLDVHVGTWEPATSLKAPDKIISSKYAGAKVFVPSYEKLRRPCIEMLISNEYQRMWWKEKEEWDKMTIPAEVGSKKRLLLHLLIKRRKHDVRPPEMPAKKYRAKIKMNKEKTKDKDPKDMEECQEAAKMETNIESCED